MSTEKSSIEHRHPAPEADPEVRRVTRIAKELHEADAGRVAPMPPPVDVPPRHAGRGR
jgi:hypothetical protein